MNKKMKEFLGQFGGIDWQLIPQAMEAAGVDRRNCEVYSSESGSCFYIYSMNGGWSDYRQSVSIFTFFNGQCRYHVNAKINNVELELYGDRLAPIINTLNQLEAIGLRDDHKKWKENRK